MWSQNTQLQQVKRAEFNKVITYSHIKDTAGIRHGVTIHLAFLTGAGDVEPVQGSVLVMTALILLNWSPGPRLRQIVPAGLMFYASIPRAHLTPTTCTPSSLALSRRCLQALREQPKVIAMSSSRQIASVATCSSSLNTEKHVRRLRERQVTCQW